MRKEKYITLIGRDKQLELIFTEDDLKDTGLFKIKPDKLKFSGSLLLYFTLTLYQIIIKQWC